MKICLVTLGFAPYRVSGLSVYGEQVALGLAQRGHQVTVLAGRRNRRYAEDELKLPNNLTLEFLPVGRLDWIGLGWQVAKKLKETKCDVVHFLDLHFAYNYKYSFVASAFQSFRQRMTSYYGGPYYTFKYEKVVKMLYYKLASVAEKSCAKRASKIVASSWSAFREFTLDYSEISDKLSVIYPGIDVDSYHLPITRADARRRLGLGLDWFILLFVGFGGPRKGLELIPSIMSKMPEFVHFISIGPWNRSYMYKFINSLDEKSRKLIHLFGYVNEERKRLFYTAADAFIFPTWLEGFGLPVAEAMAAGLPVVTPLSGATAEVVGRFGCLVKPGCVESYLSAIYKLIEDKEFRSYISEKLRRRAINLFNRDSMIDNLEKIYL